MGSTIFAPVNRGFSEVYMNEFTATRVCPASRAKSLDMNLRRLVHNPEKILSPYIRNGMRVLEPGCGPGFFTMEIARLAGSQGKVIAADMQNEMLEHVSQKALFTDILCPIKLHKCESNSIGLTENEIVDFAFVFYMLHEVPDQEHFIREIRHHLSDKGELMIVEPRFHVTREMFRKSIRIVQNCGFEISERPQIFFSRAVVARKTNESTR